MDDPVQPLTLLKRCQGGQVAVTFSDRRAQLLDEQTDEVRDRRHQQYVTPSPGRDRGGLQELRGADQYPTDQPGHRSSPDPQDRRGGQHPVAGDTEIALAQDVDAEDVAGAADHGERDGHVEDHQPAGAPSRPHIEQAGNDRPACHHHTDHHQ
ncbi:hypothetical protein SDC9_157273 [bioreactor metagenome]|uniref:Uncharacterized protein n=1 Tax=bioreactor metagenome TaxID=1076179 RepID=A0A645F7V3_9ZZZZ